MEAELHAREAAFSGKPGGEGSTATEAGVTRLPFAVLADNIRSMWNVGSIFRTADACGVERLVLAGITGTPPQRSITKVSLGAEHALRWEYRAQALAALDSLRVDGYTPVALETGDAGVPLDRFDWPVRPCLVVGHEVRGISPEVFDAVERHVFIPMSGVKDSFNVAVAFGIAAHHASAQLRGRNP